MIRIVLAGGGTGGHFYPLMAIAEELQGIAKGDENYIGLYYMGPSSYKKEELERLNIHFIWCPAGKHRRYLSPLNIIDFFKNFFGIFIAIYKLFILYPDVVMSKGGYASVPVTISAWLLRIPIVIHESDAVPGRANKLAKLFARYIAVSYEEAFTHFPKEKTALVGIPTNKVMLSEIAGNPKEILEIDGALPLILVLGGSQGAVRINILILDSLDELLPTYNIIHQTGQDNFDPTVTAAKSVIKDDQLLSRYRPVPFLDQETLHVAMSAADIIVARAGSTTIHEISLHAKPSILIPIPEGISHDQRSNAFAYARTGAATVLEEENIRDGLLFAEIDRIMKNTEIKENVSKAAEIFGKRDAAFKMADLVYQIGLEHE